MLMEVPPALLEQLALELPLGRVRIIGGEEQDAVLVTSKESYKLTRVETSNIVLLVPPGEVRFEKGKDSPALATSCSDGADGTLAPHNDRLLTVACASSYQLELQKAFPDLERIRAYLASCPYRGQEYEAQYSFEDSTLTLEDIQERVQLSEQELLVSLATLGALCIANRWRLLDADLVSRTNTTLLAAIAEADMSIDDIDAAALLSAADAEGVESIVARHCLALLATPHAVDDEDSNSSSSRPPAMTAVTALDVSKVNAFVAHQLFQQRRVNEAYGNKPWPRKDFLEDWAANVPGVEPPDETLLRGIALLEVAADGAVRTECYRYVPAINLPVDPKERLNKLFRIKTKWPLDELVPYLEPLCGPGLKVADLLVKHLRLSTDPVTGAQLYSAR
eukprot:TRINITY_DN11770_c0_g1_i1.p1 TRINITY_DN11770_c0_g1~~TRINITY_DN11770_c0_g1_i1.p1  ORF type:complete len:450 (-),score=90.08 TRINITY_DN11770_c0_g1_i1:7-1185(-)